MALLVFYAGHMMKKMFASFVLYCSGAARAIVHWHFEWSETESGASDFGSRHVR